MGDPIENVPKAKPTVLGLYVTAREAYERQLRDRDLVLDTTLSDGWASISRDELHCTSQACGYDTDSSTNCIP